jgi:hypothetical protein
MPLVESTRWAHLQVVADVMDFRYGQYRRLGMLFRVVAGDMTAEEHAARVDGDPDVAQRPIAGCV